MSLVCTAIFGISVGTGRGVATVATTVVDPLSPRFRDNGRRKELSVFIARHSFEKSHLAPATVSVPYIYTCDT